MRRAATFTVRVSVVVPDSTNHSAVCLRSFRRFAHSQHAASAMSAPSQTLASSSSSTASSTSTTADSSAEGSESWRKSRIYTKTGDTGTTSLYNMQRKCKAEDFFQALGTVDEVNSQLGSVIEYKRTCKAVTGKR